MIYNFKTMFAWLLLNYLFCVTKVFAQDDELPPTDVELVNENHNEFVGPIEPKINPFNKMASSRDFGFFDYNFNNYVSMRA
jgi:hypothetical protein